MPAPISIPKKDAKIAGANFIVPAAATQTNTQPIRPNAFREKLMAGTKKVIAVELDPPQENDLGRIMIYMVTIEVMAAFIQFMSVFILQNTFFAFLSFVPFIAIIGGFEYAYRKNGCNEASAQFRRKFYKISAWIGLYFPVRFAVATVMTLYPRPYTVLLKECIICVIYITAATIANLNTDREYVKK